MLGDVFVLADGHRVLTVPRGAVEDRVIGGALEPGCVRSNPGLTASQIPSPLYASGSLSTKWG